MNSIQGESYEVRLVEDGSTIAFRGSLRLTGSEDYAPILNLLRGTLQGEQDTVVVDFRELDFLNSSGITMFSRFVIEARERSRVHLQFVASESIPWHARSLTNLQRLMPTLTVELV